MKKCSISIVSFIILLTLVSFREKLLIDSFLYNKISLLINNNMTRNIILITNLASFLTSIIIITIVLLLLIKYKKYKDAKIFSIIIILGNICNYLFKLIIKRERPDILKLVVEKTYSFPSGHTFIVVLLYGMILLLMRKYNKLKKIYVIIYILFIILIGFTRIYLGVHYFSDVLGSIFLGSTFLIVFNYIIGCEVNEKEMVKRDKNI